MIYSLLFIGGFITWLFFIGIIALYSVYANKKDKEKKNRQYVQVVDDTYTALSSRIGVIETGLNIMLTELKRIRVVAPIPKIDASSMSFPSEKPISEFIYTLEYCRGQFADTPFERRALASVINRIKKRYADKLPTTA